MIEARTTYIRKLSVTAHTRDAARLQGWLEAALSSIEFSPPGLPASAILCVRKFEDPLPGQLSWRPGHVRSLAAWEHALRAALGQLGRCAARPTAGAVPANAQAVIFVDRAELLACLASDWCEGRIAARWWWRDLFNDTDLNTAVRQAWRAAPAYIPAALELLAEQRKAASFTRTLSMDEARDWLQALTQTFALRELHTVFSYFTPGDVSQRASDQPLVTARDAHPAQYLTPSTQHLVRPPWRLRAPEAVDSTLTSEQQLLLGIGLMLQRAPLVVRSPSFAQAIQHWIRAEPPLLSTRGEDAHLETPTAPVSAQASALQRKTTGAAPLSLLSQSLQKTSSSDLPAPDGAGMALNAAPGRQNHSNRPDAFISAAPEEEPPPFSEPARASEPLSLEQTRQAMQRATREIETAFGGVFYLVNLGLFLGLYSDFTNPLRPGISLPLWDFVALVGRELVGGQIEEDAVWTLLAELAGRADGEEPGKGFAPPEQFILPPLPARQERQRKGVDLAVALSNLAPLRQRADEKSERGETSLLRWLDELMPYLRVRLRQALGRLTEEDDPGAVLCRYWARVIATSTHVDVSFLLADLPIAIRLAGLDRDPGWVPAAGRSLAFHFV